MCREVLRRREQHRESNQQKKAGARYGEREPGNDLVVIFQGLHFSKEVIWGSFGGEKSNFLSGLYMIILTSFLNLSPDLIT